MFDKAGTASRFSDIFGNALLKTISLVFGTSMGSFPWDTDYQLPALLSLHATLIVDVDVDRWRCTLSLTGRNARCCAKFLPLKPFFIIDHASRGQYLVISKASLGIVLESVTGTRLP